MQSPVDRFVVEKTNPAGFGWCTQASDGFAVVHYFDLPDSVAEERRVPIQDLVVRDLPLEMRVWVRNKGFGWWPGRTKGKEGNGTYFVKLAEVGPVVRVPPWSIQVRWDRPLASATEALAIGMTDSPDFYRARSSVMNNLVDQRAACRGFTALLSASVKPFHHQIDVMTRVLNDPVMRFVLADEVGLGKTIEAGLIVRQVFLDQPDSRVVVCTPRTLGGQWFDELRGKLRLRQQLRSDLLRVIDHQDLSELTEEPPDLLVLDEAHQLMERAMGREVEMEMLRGVAQAVPSLLLLTATPLRGNADTFLGLLHLVDREAYPLEDLPEFRRRLELRHEQASSIELLSPQLPDAVVRSVLNEFAGTYRTDSLLQGLVRAAQTALDSSLPADETLAAVANHMRETYRVSRRVIRHRRSAAAADGFPVSGRRIQLVEVHDPAREEIDDFLEQWRRCLQSEGEANPTNSKYYALGVEAGLAGVSALVDFIDRRIDSINGEEGTEGALLRQTRAILSRRRVDIRYELLLDRVRDAGSPQSKKTVVFTRFSRTASDVGQRLTEACGSRHVALHLETMTTNDQDEAVRRFLHDPSCVVLVCDASGEEGRNLQAATQIVHLDIPLSVNQLEQRIGRADRFNESSPVGGVPSVVFAEPSSAWVSGQLHVLTDGLGVFDHSVATLQRPLADYEVDLKERLLALGVDAFNVDVVRLRERLEDERNQIDLLEELEATLTAREFTPADIAEFVEFEKAWARAAEAFDHLTSEDGGIRLRKSPRRDTDEAFSYSVDPTLQTIPLMPVHQQDELVSLLPGARTFDRTVALRNPDVHLIRVGDPLVDWIESYLRIDEGGRACAVWQHVADWPEPQAWFCFEFLLEFDERTLEQFDAGTRRRLRRRGDAYLPPRIERVWTNGTVEAPGDLADSVLEKSRGARGSGVALRGPRWATALDLLPDWTSLCKQAEQRAKEIALTRQEVLDWRKTAEAAADEEATRRVAVLKLWTDRLPRGHEQERGRRELKVEQSLGSEVTAGVSHPRSALLTVCGVIVAGVTVER